jgi:hypothetical protein
MQTAVSGRNGHIPTVAPTAAEQLDLPCFNQAVLNILQRSLAISSDRVSEYVDSWALENMVTTFLDATLKRLGITLTEEEKRLIKSACMVDIKDDRMMGPWKPDNIIDGINYRAFYAEIRQQYEEHEAARAAVGGG